MVKTKTRKCGARYPWDEWFKNDTFRLRQGKEYEGRTDSMAQLARFRAKDRGLKISIKHDQDLKGFTVMKLGKVPPKKRGK